MKHTQIENYYYRDSSLSHVNFFDFVQFFHVEKQKPLHYTKNGNPRLGTFARYSFKQEHPLSKTHEIVEHTNTDLGHVSHILVPCVVGLSMLAHFKTFSPELPFEKNESIESTFHEFGFSEKL